MATATVRRRRTTDDGSDSAPDPWRTAKLNFGLVTFEVGIKPVTSGTKEAAVRGSFVCPDHGEKTKRRWLCEAEGDEDHPEGHYLGEGEGGVVTGYKHEDGYVVPDKQDMKDLFDVWSKDITLTRAAPDNIDPTFFEKAYFVWAAPGEGEKFDVLVESLRKDKKAAIGVCNLSKRTRQIVFKWSDHFGCLIGYLCRYDTEISSKTADAIRESAASRPAPRKELLAAARPLIAALDGNFDPKEVEDTYTPAMIDLIEQTAAGEKIEISQPKGASKDRGEVDILAALRASVKATERTPKRQTTKRETAKRQTAKVVAKKPASKRPSSKRATKKR